MKNRRNFLKNASIGLVGLGLSSCKSNDHNKYPGQDNMLNPREQQHFYSKLKKSLLLSEDLIYLNTGSLGPSPAWLLERIHQLLRQLESNPVANNWGALGQQMEAVRKKVADLINAEKEEIILTRNTTEGINLMGTCFQLKAGGEILTTTHEHGGGENGLKYLAQKRGGSLRKMDLPLNISDKQELVDFIKKQISRNTRVLMLSHISTITGLKMPFEEIAPYCRSRDILLIADGAQAPGMLKTDMKKLGVDVYASSGHKWLLGPKETGFVYIRKEMQEGLKNVFNSSSNAAYSASSGTRNVASFIALGDIIDWHLKTDPAETEKRCRDLATYCRQQLSTIKNSSLISPESPELYGGMVSISLEKEENHKVFNLMQDQQIIIKRLPKYNGLRFSTHIFNNKEDIDQMTLALRNLT